VKFGFAFFIFLCQFFFSATAQEAKKTAPLPYEIIWSINFDETGSSNFITLDNKYIFTVNKNGFHALDQNSGKISWEIEADLSNLSFINYEKGFIYFAFSDGRFEVIDPENGLLRWKQKLDEPLKFAPEVFADNLFLASESFIYSFDFHTGYLFWKHKFRQKIQGLFADKNIVGVVLQKEGIKLIDIDEGLISSHFPLEEEIINTVFYSKKLIIFTSSQNNLICFSLSEKKKLWEIMLSSSSAPELLFTQTKMFLTDKKTVNVFNRENGKLFWFYNNEAEIVSPLKFYKKGIVFISKDGNLNYLNTQSQKLSWQYKIKDSVDFTLQKGDLFFVFSENDNMLKALRLY
jgi:outer membrane protein assembly factor BamB